MFSRFIVATDLSTASVAVVSCLGGLKAYGAKQCLLLQCLSLQEASSIAASYTTEILQSTLQGQKEILEEQGFTVETRVVPGFARHEINRIAAEENYSLVVVGSRGRSLVGDVFLGGVAYEVINHARKPVLLVRLEAKPGEEPQCIQASRCDFGGHILFPTDFSENADHAFTHVEELVANGAKRVTLLHVQDKARIEPHLAHRVEEFNRIDLARLEEMREILQKKGGAAIDMELRYGSPFAEIIRIIRERDVNLVVMGSQGRGFIKELFLGSVSHNVARHSDASVLLIPARREDTGEKA